MSERKRDSFEDDSTDSTDVFSSSLNNNNNNNNNSMDDFSSSNLNSTSDNNLQGTSRNIVNALINEFRGQHSCVTRFQSQTSRNRFNNNNQQSLLAWVRGVDIGNVAAGACPGIQLVNSSTGFLNVINLPNIVIQVTGILHLVARAPAMLSSLIRPSLVNRSTGQSFTAPAASLRAALNFQYVGTRNTNPLTALTIPVNYTFVQTRQLANTILNVQMSFPEGGLRQGQEVVALQSSSLVFQVMPPNAQASSNCAPCPNPCDSATSSFPFSDGMRMGAENVSQISPTATATFNMSARDFWDHVDRTGIFPEVGDPIGFGNLEQEQPRARRGPAKAAVGGVTSLFTFPCRLLKKAHSWSNSCCIPLDEEEDE